MMRPAFISVAAAIAFSACGGSSGTTPNPPTTTLPPVTTPTPAPTPNFKAQCGEPSPAPLFGMKVSVQLDNGFRKLVDSRPVVENTGRGNQAESYCGKVGFDFRAAFCDTRPEGHPQREPCDALVVGRASDTGRYGPTWSKDGKPCVEPGTATDVGCTNHAENQFLAIARGPGEMLACASNDWPATGARCGGCTISLGGGRCDQ